MKLDYSQHPITRDRTYVLTITENDMWEARYLWLDGLLLDECCKSDSIADKLLALEMIARRIEDERERLDALMEAR